MLQVESIRQNLELYSERLLIRSINAKDQLTEIIAKDNQRKNIQKKLDEVLFELNQASRTIGALMKEGKKEEAELVKQKTSTLKDESKTLNVAQNSVEQELKELLYNVPNIPNELVPFGKSEDDNITIKEGTIESPLLSDLAKAHWDLIKDYDIIDFDLGNKVTGAGFPFYKREGARLVRSMINYFLNEAITSGYEEIQAPIVINEASGLGTGQLPDKEGQMYQITGSNLYLIPTAEVPLTNIYRDVILSQQDLPVKLVGYTSCFRKEAGSWGAHVRGLNRLHQFDKIEIVQIVEPDKSYETLDEMIAHVEGLIKNLELPYRIMRLCGGDLGFTSALTYDFEVYSAAQKKWLEVSSVSNFENFQANRLKLRYKNESGKKILAHTLNGSALAIPRILAALLENNQTDNSISIPAVLRPYTGFDKILR